MQPDNPLQDVDLINALHKDSSNQLAKLLIEYLEEAYSYISMGSKELSKELQHYLEHLLTSIKKAKRLLIEMAEVEIDDEDFNMEEAT